MINDGFLLGFPEKSLTQDAPLVCFKFLYWSKKLSLKNVRLQIGILQYILLSLQADFIHVCHLF